MTELSAAGAPTSFIWNLEDGIDQTVMTCKAMLLYAPREIKYDKGGITILS